VFEFLTAGSKIAPEPKARVPARLTWRDFPDFVREVDELFRVRGIHEENLKVLRGRMSTFDNDIGASATESRIAARAESMRSGSLATIAAPPSLNELHENVQASGILVAKQMAVVKSKHVKVKEQIGGHYLERWRSIIARNRNALLELQAALNGMRAMRTEILIDCGEGEEWGNRGAIEGGIGQPAGMIVPLSVSNFKGESDFVHLLKAQVSHFADSAKLYLETSERWLTK
jgi:hypothetical protein